MHILIIPSEHFLTKDIPYGGIFQFHQGTALVNAGLDVGVLASGFRPFSSVFKAYEYIDCETLNGMRVFRNYAYQPLPFRFLTAEKIISYHKSAALQLFEKYIKSYGKPDCVHAHSIHLGGVVANQIKQKYGIPFVYTEHESRFGRGVVENEYRNAYNLVVENAAICSAVSTSLSNLLWNFFSDTGRSFEVLPNVIDPVFSKLETRSPRKEVKPFTFLHIGSLDENKNQEGLIRSFSSAFKGQNVQLRIGGEGRLYSYLIELGNKLGISDQIQFLGRLSRHTVYHELSNSDCFVLGSKYETFGVVLIESLAMGVPVIATNCGGPADIVNEENGILVSSTESAELIAAMKKMVEISRSFQPDKLKHDVISRFGEMAFAKKAIALYNRALKE